MRLAKCRSSVDTCTSAGPLPSQGSTSSSAVETDTSHCPVTGCQTSLTARGFKHPGDCVRHVQEQHTQKDLLCPVNGCHLSVPGKGFKRWYRMVNHLMAPSHPRARGHDLKRDEAECRADAVADAVKAQRTAAALALFAAAGMAMPSRLDGTGPTAATTTGISPWPSLPMLADSPAAISECPVDASQPTAATRGSLTHIDATYGITTLGDDVGMTFDGVIDPRLADCLSSHGRTATQGNAAVPMEHSTPEDFMDWEDFPTSPVA